LIVPIKLEKVSYNSIFFGLIAHQLDVPIIHFRLLQ